MKIMWHPEQKSMILASQVTGTPKACIENIEMFPLCSVSERDLLAEPTRKRKTLDLDHQRNNASNGFSKLVLDHSFLGKPHQQLKVTASLGKNATDDALEMFSNHGPQTAKPTKELVQFCRKNVPDGSLEMFPHHGHQTVEPAKELVQFGCSKCYSRNDMPWSVNIHERNSSNTMSDMWDSHLNAVARCLVPEVSLACINSPAGKIPALLDSHTIEPKILSKAESFDTPYPIPNSMVRVQSDWNVKGSMVHGERNHVVTSNSSYQLQQMASEVFCSSDILMVKHKAPHQPNLSGGKPPQEVHKSICSVENKQSERVVLVDTKNGNNGSSAKIGSGISEGTGDEAINVSCLKFDDSQKTHSPENDVGGKMKCKEQISAGQNIQNTEKKKDQNIETVNNSLRKEISLNIAVKSASQIVVEGCHGNNSQPASSASDRKCKASTGNVASTVAEKLWDGSLQLNAFTKVSAVAFFKSGEKAPGFLWSQSIEVKGKVRLEAFEKFIQELPRSRSRGLMVTSLCWKFGSSEAGLNGMKQVAKSYKDGEKVGFAQLSPGIDLYVCPRSDTIITILAKYGFFKGMAAIEDDKDSLIGCFVWRKHRSSLDTVSKKQNRKILPLPKKSPESHTEINTITQLNADASAQVDGSFTTPVSRIGSTAPESAKGQSFEGNNIQSIQAPFDVSNVAATMKLAPSVPDSSPAGSCVHQTDAHSIYSLKSYKRLEASTAPIGRSEQEKTASLGLMGSLLIQPNYPLKLNKHMPDDDDLPEFDFGIACGVSHSSQSKSVATSGTVLLGMKPSMPHIIEQTTITNHSKSETPSFSNRLETNRGLPPLSKQGEDECIRPLSFSGERLVSTHSEMLSHPSVCKRTSNKFISLKNRWDDDDDMPEWCPPDFGHQDNLPGMSIVRPLVPTVPSFLPNSTSEKKPHAPPMPKQIQTFLHGKQNHIVSVAMKPSQKQTNPADEHVKFRPRSSLEPNSSSYFVSFPYNFDARVHTQSTLKGWRP